MKYHRHLNCLKLALIALSITFGSCDNGPDPVIPVGADGFFVINEGGFGNGNSSISFFDRKTGEMTNDVFALKNGRPLGDQAQSMTVFEGKGFVVVQNSAKVEVIDAADFSSIQTITVDIESPRYFIGVSSTKGYLSDWGNDGVSGTIKVIDLNSYTVTRTVPVGQGPNRFLIRGNKVYVANSGGFGKDNTIKVIDTSTDEVVKTITVGDNPNSLQADVQGNIWVASGGALVYNQDFSINEDASTKGSISKLAPDDSEMLRLTLTTLSYSWIGQLQVSPAGDVLYYNFDGALFSFSTSATALPDMAFIDDFYYGFAIDPFNGNVIATAAPNFSSAGQVHVYTSAGILEDIFEVGIAPNGCAFK